MTKMTILKPLFIALVALFLLPLSVMAQTPEAKILVVDFLAVNEKSLVGRDVEAQLRQYELVLEGRMTELQNQFKAESDAIQSQQAIMSQEQYQEQVLDYQRRVQDANTEIEGKRDLLLKAAQGAQLEINRVVRPIINDIMRNRDATMVVDSDFVYASTGEAGVDITNEVISRLDADLRTYAIRDPNQ